MPAWSTGISLKPAAGLSVLSGPNDPTANDGTVGQPGFLNTSTGKLFGQKTADGWPTTYLQLALAGAEGSLPDDLTGNSLVLSPVSGDANQVQLQILTGAGNPVFSCDATGDVSFAGSLSVTGQATLPNLSASNVVSSTQTILDMQHVRGTLTVDGETTLADVQAQSGNVSGTLQVGTLQSGDVETSSLTTTGNIHAKTLMTDGAVVAAELAAENLTVGTAADIGKGTSKGKFFGDVEVLGDSQVATLEASQLAVSGTSSLEGAISGGPLTVPSVTVALPASGAAADPILMTGPDGTTLFAVDGSGNATLKGTLQISGSEASGALQTDALTAASIVNTGDTSLQGALTVQGQTTLQAVSATAVTGQTGDFSGNLTAGGATSLQGLTATDVSTGTLETTGATTLGAALSVTGASTLQGLTASDIQAHSLTTSAGTSVGANLTVGGSAALHAVSGDQATFSGLHVTGAGQVDGTLVAGSTTVPALAVQLPSSNASATPFTVADASGNSLLSFTKDGALTIAGQLIVNGGNASGAESLGAVTVSSFLDQGNGEVQGSFKVDGATTLQGLTATDITAASLNLSGNSTVGGTGSYTGALSSASLSTGPITSSSLKTQGVSILTDQYGNGGTLTVAAQANLPTTYTADLHPASVSTSGSETVGGNLSVSGSTSLATLSASSATTLQATTTGALTASSLNVGGATSLQGALSVGGALTGTTLQLQSSSSLPIQILDASGNVLLSQDGQGNLDIKGTLSVSGQPTGSANNLGAVTVTSFVDSGSAQVQQNLSVSGTSTLASLAVSGATTLGSTTLGQTTTGALTASSGSFSGAVGVGTTLTVGGASSLQAVTAAAIQAASLTTSGAVSVGTTLGVSGNATLQALSAAQATLSGAQVSGNVSVGGTLGVTGLASFNANANVSGNLSVGGTALISGATTVPSLSVALPSSGASSQPVAVVTNSGSKLLILDGSGNLTIAGAINAAGGTTNGGAISATSITDSGALTVQGSTSLQAVTVTQLTNSGSSQAAALTVQLPSSSPAAKPINLLSATGVSLASIDSSGNALFGGTLGVTGATSLTTLSTSGLATLNSASVSGALSAGATTLSSLTVSNALSAGASTLSSLTVSGAETVGGALGVSGAITAPRVVFSGPGSASSPLIGYTTTGNSSNYVSGLYSESNFGQWYETIGGAVARSITYTYGNLNNASSTFYTHNFYSGVSGAGNLAHRFFVSGGNLAFSLNGSGGAAFAGALSVAGATTSAGFTLSSGALTFADGTSLSTATAANQTAYTATAVGTAASPAFKYSGGTNPAGMFFDAAPGNVYLSVNGYKSLYSTAASGAAQGANGWVISSTLGAGNNLLALYGSPSTTTPVWSVDGAGAVTAASQTTSGAVNAGSVTSTGVIKGTGLTITASGGALTFGDGTTMTTASTGSGSASSSTSVPQLRYGTGAPTTGNPQIQNDGDFFNQTDQNLLWGPRASGTWPSTPLNLIGPQGIQGVTGATGATGPCRSMVYAGTYWNTACAANTTYVFQDVVQSGTTVGQTPATTGMTRAGSVVGYSMNQVGAVTGTFSVIIQKNGATLYTFASVGSGIKTFTGTLAAGSYTFAAGDTLTMAVTTTGTGNIQAFGQIEIQTN